VSIAARVLSELKRPREARFEGRVTATLGMTLEVDGLHGILAVGDRFTVTGKDGREISCEAVGLKSGRTLALAFESVEGITLGATAAYPTGTGSSPGIGWLGRIVDGLGRPVDGKGELPRGDGGLKVRRAPPPAYGRRRVGARLQTGVKALDAFAPLCRGQRLGLFAGSGVGKSTLMAMLARNAEADAIVIGLVGERGREVQEFVQEHLGEEGLARSIVISATSDQGPLLRREAGYMTLAAAEALRDAGLHVLCLMDSVTRFAMAQREIGLAAGEPPTTKGYTPTVFAELPRLLERAGPGSDDPGVGDITAVFTVLVDGDDHNEPIADAVRGILDGHVVMTRRIAERGRFPAIDVLKSVSRTLPDCLTPQENEIREKAKVLLAAYEDMEELIRIGAYTKGADATVDKSIKVRPQTEAFLRQSKEEVSKIDETFAALAKAIEPAGAPTR
jgi:flagellum-specific ATP synthase